MPWGSSYTGQTEPAPARGGWGSKYTAPIGAHATTAKKSGGGGGLLSVLSHLGADVKDTIVGLPTGIVATAEHPIRAAKAIGHSYSQMYGPLFEGHFTDFLHNVEQHPLQPLLDAATIATLGAGGAAKAAELLSRAGVVSDTSRLATLSHAADLTVPDFGAGENIVVKQTSRNPLIRARQQAVNAGLNMLPSETPVVGSTARGVRALSRGPERAGARLDLHADAFRQAFDNLNPAERTAWHLRARAVTPGEYAAFLKAQPNASPAMLATLANPDVATSVATPSSRLATALDLGRSLSDKLTALRVNAGHLDQQTALEAPYRLARLVNGATYGAEGLTGGKTIEQLIGEGRDPFYVPDSAHTPGMRGRFTSRPAGYAAPSAGIKQNRGVLVSRGLINVNDNALARDYTRFKNVAQAQLLHDELVKHAAILPHGEPIPPGYEELKLNHGASSAPYTQRVGGRVEQELGGDSSGLPPQEREFFQNGNPKGNERLIVPAQVRAIVEDNTRTATSKLARLVYHQPTSVWKHLVLGLRPAFMANISIGNSILGALQMAPGRHGLMGWLNQVVPGAEHALGPKLTEETMRNVFPEQVSGTFGRSTGFTSNRGLNVAAKAYQGVMPATIAYENVLRRAMAEGWAKFSPEVRAHMDATGGDVNTALQRAAQTHPQIIDAISRRIDDALGNYRTYNRVERAVKTAVPFYGWNRHITRSAARLALERPAVLDALHAEGAQGKELADEMLGALPSYLEGSLRLPGMPRWLHGTGTGTILSTKSLNPFNTLVDEAELGRLAYGRKPGTIAASLPINPLVQALLEQYTGTSLLTGAPVKGSIYERLVQGLPQVLLEQELAGAKQPKPGSVNQSSALERLAKYLGVPIEEINGTAAATAARKGR